MNESQQKRRGWLKFSLRSLLLVSTLLSLGLGWIGNTIVRVKRQRASVAKIHAAGGRVRFDYQWRLDQEPPGPEWMRILVGDDVFASVDAVTVDFADVKDPDLVFAAIKQLPRLRCAELKGAAVTDSRLAEALNFKPLHILSLTSARVTPAGLAQLRDASDLDFLELRGEWVGDDTMAAVGSIPNLHILVLDQTDISDLGLGHVAALKSLEELGVIDSSGIGAAGLESLGGLTSLKKLSLSGTRLSGEGLRSLSALKHLETLNLSGTSLTDSEISDLKGLDRLAVLDLRGTFVGNDGLRTVAQMQSLQKLSLGARVTDAGMTEVAKLQQLADLDISESAVTDTGLFELASLHNLRDLYVDDQITYSAALKFRHADNYCSIRGSMPRRGSQ
jgi:hypothetical protein